MRKWEEIAEFMCKHLDLDEIPVKVYLKLQQVAELCEACDGGLVSRQVIALIIVQELG